jgi:hypothetical protein
MGSGLASRVLVTGMADSVHLARWLSQFRDQELEIRLVSSSPHRRVHPQILGMVADNAIPLRLTIGHVSKRLSLPLWLADRFLGDWLRAILISLEIRRFAPDFVHVNELQNAGYATRRAYQLLKKSDRPPLLITNYGSELVWFQKYGSHQRRLRALLAISKGFSAECKRDYDLARQLGFKGINFPLMPVAGGMAPPEIFSESRTIIAIKGYQNKWGRALTVLSALEKNAALFGGFEFQIFSANQSVIRRVKLLSRSSGLRMTVHGKGKLSHGELMSTFSRSIAYVGFSMSDGISTSMLEAMANGAIPIQTCTSCADEWVEHTKTGYILEPTDSQGLIDALKDIISGTFDVKFAREANLEVIRLRYDQKLLQEIAIGYYGSMMEMAKGE